MFESIVVSHNLEIRCNTCYYLSTHYQTHLKRFTINCTKETVEFRLKRIIDRPSSAYLRNDVFHIYAEHSCDEGEKAAYLKLRTVSKG